MALLKNGQPCTDEYEWKCDHCGKLTCKGIVPEGATYDRGYCGHFVDIKANPPKTIDLCPVCSLKFIRSARNAAAAESGLGGFFKPGCTPESPEWLAEELKDEEPAPTAQKEPDVK